MWAHCRGCCKVRGLTLLLPLRGFKGESALAWLAGRLLGGTCAQSFVGSAARALLAPPSDCPPDQLAPSGTWHLNCFPLFSGSRNCNPAASRPLPPREEEVQCGL